MSRKVQADERKLARRRYLCLLAIPFIWQVGGIPFVNDVAWAPLHIPFPMLWQMMGIVITSVVIALVFHFDKQAGLEHEEADFLANTTSGSEGGH